MVIVVLVIIMVLAVLVILFTLRRKNQKTTVLEQPQGAVLESRESMIRNDAYMAVNAMERSEAYMTNADDIPSSQNEADKETFAMIRNDAYSTVITKEANMTNTDAIPAARKEANGAVATELEGGDMNDAVYEEPQGQSAQDQNGEEYSYAFVC